MKRSPDQGYFHEPAKSLFISDTPWKEEATKTKVAVEGLTLNFVSRRRYLGAYLGLQKELEAWIKPQLEAWAHRVRVLCKIARRHPQLAYAGFGMLFQLEWQYLKTNFPRVGTLMGPIEEALREKLFPALFRGE